MEYRIRTPLDEYTAGMLRAGDVVYISGTVFGARDAAHKKMSDLIASGCDLPFDIRGQVIYYVGPCPARAGMVIGSAGPTTSSRMDIYAPRLIRMGLRGMIGKGLRSSEVKDAMKCCKAVYFAAVGGAGALLAERISAQSIIAFPELGPEALRKLTLVEFPTVVAIDSIGTDIYEKGRELYHCEG